MCQISAYTRAFIGIAPVDCQIGLLVPLLILSLGTFVSELEI